MLSDEEKEALEILKGFEPDDLVECAIYLQAIEKIKNLIEKQSKEIEHQIEKRANQRKELAILNAKQVEFNKLVNTVNSYKGQFKRQEKEIEELKEDNKHQWEERCKLTLELENSTSNDKIKAKIEEVKDGTFDAKIVLQSLLEKE
jgi:hypothetical protein